MTISEKLKDVQLKLKELERNHKFKKANRAREDAAQLTSALAKCRGQLEICQKEFNRKIKEQAKNIKEGRSIGADTTIQEQMLWDAAIGYMLVKEASFQLRSVSSSDSISHAYDILDATVRHMSGKTKRLKMPKFNPLKKREDFAFVTADEAVNQKEELLETFFEKLKINGDIEACLANPSGAEVNKDGKAVKDPYMAAFDSLEDEDDASIEFDSLDGMVDIHSPGKR